MKTLIILLFTLTVNICFAHPGHGIMPNSGWLHYLFDHRYLLSIASFVILLFFVRKYRTRQQQ